MNNLLENLDGQAETVAETVADVAEQATSTGITNNLRRLNNTIATNASVLRSNIANSEYRNNIINNNLRKIESFDSEYDSYDDDDSGFFEDDEFLDTDEDDDNDVDEPHGSIEDEDKDGNPNQEPNSNANNAAKPVIKSVADTASGQPTKNRSQDEDNPVSVVVNNNTTQTQPDYIAKTATKKNSGAKMPGKNLQVIPNKTGKPAVQKKSSWTVSLNQQNTTKPQKLPKNPNAKASKENVLAIEAKQKKKIGSATGDRSNSSKTESQNSGAAVASTEPSASQKDAKIQKKTERPKTAKGPENHQKPSDSSNKKNITAVSKKLEETDKVPDRSPPPSEKVHSKPNLVAPTTITAKGDTKIQSGKSKADLEKMQRQHKNEIKLLKKQQQQQQQVVASKNKTIQSLESQLSKLREELTKGAAQHEKLNLRTKDLDDKLQASEREIEAQAEELRKAGEEMEKIRANAKEEREDLLDDHDDEMEDLQRNHQDALDKMRQNYEATIAEWKDRYASEESLRQQEGGDSIKELQNATKREREALKKLAEVTEERSALQAKLDQVVENETKLKQQVESSLGSAETVAAREQRARDELDEATALHAKQMAQRQRREAELEQTILEMGSALTSAKQQLRQQQQSLSSPKGKASVSPSESNQEQTDGSDYKEKYEQVTEELETVRVRLTLETQRREALQQELSEVAMEREEELSLAQTRQLQHDSKVADLKSTIHRLQASIRGSKRQPSQSNDSNDGVKGEFSGDQGVDTQQKYNQELEAAKQEVTNLSERLFRQQALAKNAKSEILALKGRLKAANDRAEEAEKYRYNPKTPTNQRSHAYDVEGGGANGGTPAFSARRRIKGGSSRGVRSIRSSLPCFGSGRASTGGDGVLDQVGLTIDAIDSWMVETGSFMRHEPFARLGLLAYLTILHLWSFALVVFHTTEVEHGDFGSMDSNPRHWREHS